MAINQAYSVSDMKIMVDTEQKYFETYGKSVYDRIPLNNVWGATLFIGYSVSKKECRLPINSNIEVGYNNGQYSLNFKWSLE